jgi:hypothetical protein
MVEAMLSFLYKHEYDDAPQSQTYPNLAPELEPMVLNARVWTIADKYFIVELERAAMFKFAKRVEKDWATPAFAHAITEVYTTCPQHEPQHEQQLQLYVLHIVAEHYDTLLATRRSSPTFTTCCAASMDSRRTLREFWPL